MRRLLILVMWAVVPMLLTGCDDAPWVIMTYNVLNGAGVDALTTENQILVTKHGYPENRLEEVINVVKDADPDFLAIQEAHQWDQGDPSTMQTFSEETGMPHYFFIKSSNSEQGSPSSAFFSRFPIIETENYGGQFSRAAGRVVVLVPGDKRMTFFPTHLDTHHSENRQRELNFLVGEIEPHIRGTVILLGDMNFVDNGSNPESAILNEAGMRHPLREEQGIDQVWVPEHLEDSVELGEIPGPELTDYVSDHEPMVVEL